jgi:hypothetical protein
LAIRFILQQEPNQQAGNPLIGSHGAAILVRASAMEAMPYSVHRLPLGPQSASTPRSRQRAFRFFGHLSFAHNRIAA